MKSPKINIAQGYLCFKVIAIGAVVEVVRGVRVVEGAFAAGRDEVVRVDGFDEGGHFLHPGGEGGGVAVVGAAREVAAVGGTASGLVGEFPGHDCCGVTVAGDEGFDVVFVGIFDLGEAVELEGIVS